MSSMPLVDLGVDNRNPGRAGQKKLLRVAFGEESDFQMVVFENYKKKLERIQVGLNKRTGGFAWVIGDRGTGKSEVLSHLFCRQIKSGSLKKVPRIPLYISVSSERGRAKVPGGVAKGKVTMSLLNHLSSAALIDTFEFLREYDGKSEFYPELRELVKGQFYDWANVRLRQTDFDLQDFLSDLREKVLSYRKEELFTIVLIVDDIDKISEESATEFFSTHQTDLKQWVGDENIVILSSVTKEFIKEGRAYAGLNYCLNRRHMPKESELTELVVPDLGDLLASDVQDLINDRLTYLHYSKPEDRWDFEWESYFDRSPHVSSDKVLDDPKWASYDTRNMRRNAALLSLNAWVAVRKQEDIRQVLRSLQAVLNDCDKPKEELTAKILENKLKANDSSEIRLLEDELVDRISEIKTGRLQKEHILLSEFTAANEESEVLWRDLLNVTLEKSSLGEWGIPAGMSERRAGNIKDLTNNAFTAKRKNSAVFQFLNLIVELGTEDSSKVLLPSLHSRTPDDVFSIITAEKLMALMTRVMVIRKKAEFTKEMSSSAVKPILKESDSGRGSFRPGTGIVGEAYHRVIGTDDGTEELDPRHAREIGMDMGLEIVRAVMLLKDKPGESTTIWQKKNHEIKTQQKDDSRQFRRSLLQWVALRTDAVGVESKALVALDRVLQGVESFALQDPELAGALDTIVKRDAISISQDVLEGMKKNCESQFPESCSIGFDVNWVGKPLNIEGDSAVNVLKSDLKASETITVWIRDQLEETDLSDIAFSLSVLYEELGKIEDEYFSGRTDNNSGASRMSVLQGLDYTKKYKIIIEMGGSKERFGVDWNVAFGNNPGPIISQLTEADTQNGGWAVEGKIGHNFSEEMVSSLTIKFRDGPYGSKMRKGQLQVPPWKEKE